MSTMFLLFTIVISTITGGAGEGVQTLNPENPVRNKNEVKTDATLPAYCNPPNPCPVGYSGEFDTNLAYVIVIIVDT